MKVVAEKTGVKIRGDGLVREVLNRGIIMRHEKRLDEAIALFEESRPIYEALDDLLSKAKFSCNLANVLSDKGERDKDDNSSLKALFEYSLAQSYLTELGDFISYALINNNVADTLRSLGRTKEAHEKLDHAEQVFTEYHEETYLAQTLDVRANTFKRDGLYMEAHDAISRAVGILKHGIEQAPLIEALQTQEKIARGLATKIAIDTTENLNQAARKLGLTRPGLVRRLKEEFPELLAYKGEKR